MNINEDYPFEFEGEICKSCGGRCCTGEGGYVFVSIKEMEEIAAYLNLSFEAFCAKYVRKVGYRFSLIEKSYNNALACVFFNTQAGKCDIYTHRPKQCQDFPFWSSYKNLNKAAIKLLKKECPGIRVKKE